MTADGRNLTGNQPRQSMTASPPASSTPHIIRIGPVLLAEVEPDTDEHKVLVISRDRSRFQIIYVAGDLHPQLFPAIAAIGARWLMQAAAAQVRTEYRARRRAQSRS